MEQKNSSNRASSRELYYARQLEALRRVSDKVVHDINNLLSGISGYSELLLLELPADNLRAPIEEIKSAGRRISALAQFMAAFGTRHNYRPERMDLNELFSGLAGFMTGILGKSIDFTWTRNPDLWPVEADPAKTKQMLATAAIEFENLMPEGGRLSISALNIQTDTQSASDGCLRAGVSYIQIVLEADGRTAMDTISGSLLHPGSLPDSSGRDLPDGLPPVSFLAGLANGHAAIDTCSECKLRLSIYLPAAHSHPDTQASPPMVAE